MNEQLLQPLRHQPASGDADAGDHQEVSSCLDVVDGTGVEKHLCG